MSYVSKVLEVAAVLGGGVDRQLAPARELLARAVSLDAELDAARRAADRDRAGLVRAVAAGEIPAGDVPPRLAGLVAWEFDSAPSLVLVAAIGALRTEADRLVMSSAPGMFAEAQKMAAQCVAVSTDLAGRLPAGVSDDRGAYRAGAGEVWGRLGEANARFVRVHELAAVMRRAQWIDPVPPSGLTIGGAPVDPYVWCGWPAKLPAGFARLPAELRLSAAEAAGAAPGLYSGPDARRRWRVANNLPTSPRRTEIRRMDALGNPTGDVVAVEETFDDAGAVAPMGKPS